MGALSITLVVYRIGAAGGFLSLPSVLLAGIALNALAMAGVGFLSYLASDEQLRNLTFWNFGSLGGATWTMLVAVAPLAIGATWWRVPRAPAQCARPGRVAGSTSASTWRASSGPRSC